MVSANLVAAVVTLVPAMALLWAFLRRYEGYFEQNRLFFALVIGLFAGIAVRAMEVFLFLFDYPRAIQLEGPISTSTLVYSFAYTTFGFALLETLGKTAILGFKKFRSRKDTPYYGVALGLGFGAMWVIQVMSRPFTGIQMVDGHLRVDTFGIAYDLFLLALGIGLLLAHGASAVWVGRGCADGKLWKGAMHGTLWMAPGLACYWLWLNPIAIPRGPAAFAALAWGIFAMAFADRRILLKIVPPEIREMVRKERRREARKQTRD